MRRAVARMVRRFPPGLRRALRRLPGAGAADRALLGSPTGPQPAPGTLRPVVALPTWLRWGEMRQRPQYLLAALATAGHPVYFVDPRERRSRSDYGVAIVPSFRQVPARSVLLYVHYAPTASMADRFEDAIVVYDVLDDLSLYAATDRGLPVDMRVEAHHSALLDRADVVTVSSQVLASGLATTRPDAVLVENGVDLERFSAPRSRPPDLPTGAPIIGYHGAIAPWFDLELFAFVAEHNPGWYFVLVGPVAAEVRAAVAAVSRLSNVFVLGERPSDSMPAYVQAFDVGAVWFRIDDLTRAVSPLKVFECLACGVPVVSTRLPGCEGIPGVALADDPAGFARAIGEAIGGSDNRQRLQAAAADAAWSQRIKPLLTRLDMADLRKVPG